VPQHLESFPALASATLADFLLNLCLPHSLNWPCLALAKLALATPTFASFDAAARLRRSRSSMTPQCTRQRSAADAWRGLRRSNSNACRYSDRRRTSRREVRWIGALRGGSAALRAEAAKTAIACAEAAGVVVAGFVENADRSVSIATRRVG
jgi:hypothetical protein